MGNKEIEDIRDACAAGYVRTHNLRLRYKFHEWMKLNLGEIVNFASDHIPFL